jgi:hypothetical protein
MYGFLEMCERIKVTRSEVVAGDCALDAADVALCILRKLGGLVRLNYGRIELVNTNDVIAVYAAVRRRSEFWPHHVLSPSVASPAVWRALMGRGPTPDWRSTEEGTRFASKLAASRLVACVCPLDEHARVRRAAFNCTLVCDVASGARLVVLCSPTTPDSGTRTRCLDAATQFARALSQDTPWATQRVVHVLASNSSAKLVAVVIALAMEAATCVADVETALLKQMSAHGWRTAAGNEMMRRFSKVWFHRKASTPSQASLHGWFEYENETLAPEVAMRFPNGVSLMSVPQPVIAIKVHVSVDTFAQMCGMERAGVALLPTGTRAVACDAARIYGVVLDGEQAAHGAVMVRVSAVAAVQSPLLWENVAAQTHTPLLRAALIPRDDRFTLHNQVCSVQRLLAETKRVLSRACDAPDVVAVV